MFLRCILNRSLYLRRTKVYLRELSFLFIHLRYLDGGSFLVKCICCRLPEAILPRLVTTRRVILCVSNMRLHPTALRGFHLLLFVQLIFRLCCEDLSYCKPRLKRLLALRLDRKE
jgi:hypothetical protein